MSKFGQDLLQSIREARAIARGEMQPARSYTFDAPDVAAIRKRLKLTQGKFAARFGIPVGTLRDWEQGRRQPDAPARNLLRVIEYAPETVERALKKKDAA
jgi:putative transcriptional regulator